MLNKLYMHFLLKLCMSIFKKEEPQAPAPPAPPSGNGLNDIKNEIAPPQEDNSNQSAPPPSPQEAPMPSGSSSESTTPQEQPSNPFSPGSNDDNSIDEDSLFNLDDFELPNLEMDMSEDEPRNLEANDSTLLERSSQRVLYSAHEEEPVSHYHHEHHHRERSHFVPTKGLSTVKNDTYFLTTTEFKSLLEKIESVKNRIKTSSHRHMKIMNIKAEEDIELDSLRKDFQFIEDKLYEVDSTIFDR